MLGGQNLQEVTWVTPTTGGTRAPRDSLTCCHHGLPWAYGPLDTSSAPGSRFLHVGTRGGGEGPQILGQSVSLAQRYPHSPPLGSSVLLSPGAPAVSSRVWVQLPETQISPSPWGLAWLLAAPPLPQVPATPAGHSPSEEDALGGVC